MRVFVLGATGKTGGALVARALARGHRVTTFGRSPFAGQANGNLQNVRGDPLQAEEISTALPGHDAVLSVLGTRGIGATSLLEQSSRATISAMRQTGAHRLIIVSSALLDANISFMSRLVARSFLRHHAADQRAMEELVTTSELDWTVLRPTRMSDSAPHDSVAMAGEDPAPANETLIRKDEVARVVLDAAETGKYIGEIVHLSGGSR